MNFLDRIFNIKTKRQFLRKEPKEDLLHLWEDDYLMIELIPSENLEFVKKETKRIEAFGEEHFDGTGFTDITPIGEQSFKTLDKMIQANEVRNVFSDVGLDTVTKVHQQGVGKMTSYNPPYGFGTTSFAVLIDQDDKTGYLEHISLTGKVNPSKLDKLTTGLMNFASKYDFIGVNWYRTFYSQLTNEKEAKEFIINSC